MGRTEGFFLKELSQDFGMITAPLISPPHAIKRPRRCPSQMPSSSTPSASPNQKLGHRRKPGFNQVFSGKGSHINQITPQRSISIEHKEEKLQMTDTIRKLKQRSKMLQSCTRLGLGTLHKNKPQKKKEFSRLLN